MPMFGRLFRCVAKAVAKNCGKLLLGNFVGQVISDTWDFWSHECQSEKQRLAEIEAIAQATPADVRVEVEKVVGELEIDLSPDQSKQLSIYLSFIPAAIRRSLRRPSDITGTSLPLHLSLRSPEDLVQFLLANPPRLHVGDRPIAQLDYELVELLGVGGFGEVWKARNPHFDSLPPVALKFFFDNVATEFLRHEASVINQVMRQGKHEGIVQLRQSYLRASPACLEYEYVDGGDLAGLVRGHKSQNPMGPARATTIIREIAEIVSFAHQCDPPIVHRDLKPANVLIQSRADRTYQFKIADFGIGGVAVQCAIEQTRRGTAQEALLVSGLRGSHTPLYASPQQMRGYPPDPRDDVYSLGVIWFQLITGDLSSGIVPEWREEVRERGLADPLVLILASCIVAKAENRLPNASALVEAIKNTPANAGVSAEQDSELLNGSQGPAPPSSTVAVPMATFRLQNGEMARDLDGLVSHCETNWEEAEQQLMGGQFEPWLRANGHDILAAKLTLARDSGRSATELLCFLLLECGQKGRDVIDRRFDQLKPQALADRPESVLALGIVVLGIPLIVLVICQIVGWSATLALFAFATLLLFGRGIAKLVNGLLGIESPNRTNS